MQTAYQLLQSKWENGSIIDNEVQTYISKGIQKIIQHK